MALPSRKDIPVELTWDLNAIYATEEDMYRDFEKMKALCTQMEKKYKNQLNTPEKINACLDDLREIDRIASLTGNYCDLAVSVDYNDDRNQERNSRVSRDTADIYSRLSFIDSEIAVQDKETIQEAMSSSKENRTYLEDILRDKPHNLCPEAERVLSALSQTVHAPYRIYNMIKLTDIKFDSFTADGKEYPLSYSLYENDYAYDERTNVRRTAFDCFSKKIKQCENTLAAVYDTQIQTEKIIAGLRGFDSVIDSLLFHQKVGRELYHRQIDLITKKLAPHMRKYARLLKKIHRLDRMTFADLLIAVDPEYDPKVSIEDSKKYIINGLSILGDEYVSMIKDAYENRWIDFAQNQGKSTGGFCASPYGTNSFILLSWSERMSNVFTLAHELGHAGHFRLCNHAQSVFDTRISTYFVESPSTMNELLMAHYLLKTDKDRRFCRWVLSCMIRNTYYHNFVTHLIEAAYQREVYKIVDNGGSVQARTLNRLMKETLQNFWGDDVEISDDAALTWTRQPHYYMGLYSYTYSAGLTIATQVCKRIEKEGRMAVDDWKKALAAGSTKTPVELAQMVGVDITTDKPLLDTIETIGGIIDEICSLTDELDGAL